VSVRHRVKRSRINGQDIFHGFVCLPLNIVAKIGADYARELASRQLAIGLSSKQLTKGNREILGS
jgi:hypothetical protein